MIDALGAAHHHHVAQERQALEHPCSTLLPLRRVLHEDDFASAWWTMYRTSSGEQVV